MTDLPARTPRRPADTAPPAADRGVATPLPAPQYSGLFIEPDLPPVADEPE
ncbi:hypothetical protein AB0M42_00055 [Streptomyces sp. NPDC051784]|uniref:hypothetical protein n=1 Tax=Streptomyces sp. NPDC051784 TaxID=3155805 RepID=UPI00344669FD